MNEQLELLLNMNKPSKDGKLVEKLAKLQSDIKGIKKDGIVTGGASYSFIKDEDVQREIAQEMAKEGIVLNISFIPDTIKTKEKTMTTKSGASKIKYEFEAIMHYQFMYKDEIVQGFFPVAGSQFDDVEKSMGTALTYSKRFFLIKYFHIGDPVHDEDAKSGIKVNHTTGEVQNVQLKPRVKPETEDADIPIDKPVDKPVDNSVDNSKSFSEEVIGNDNDEAQKIISMFFTKAAEKIKQAVEDKEERKKLAGDIKLKLSNEVKALGKKNVKELTSDEANKIVNKLTGKKGK